MDLIKETAIELNNNNNNNNNPEALEQILSKLDNSQRLAVCGDPGRPLLIIAGAGSGKTLTMASRIAFLLLNKIPPEQILALCFSRQAAEALRARVASVLPISLNNNNNNINVNRLKLKTFHAFGLECLRRHECIELNTEVYDARRQRELAAAVVETHAIHQKSIEAVLALIEYVNRAKTKKEMRAGMELDPARQPAYLFRFYQQMLHEERRAVDFGDLEQMLLNALRPVKAEETSQLQESSENGIHICSSQSNNNNNNNNMGMVSVTPRRVPSPMAIHLRSQYSHIVVDEFQDLNEVQLECLALLAGDACRVTCVGDPNQCIYTWRGATTNTFERWRSRFPQTQLIKLATNYRSSEEIVNAVNKVVQLSQQSFKGQCGRSINLVRCQHACEQLLLLPRVIEELLRARDHTLNYNDIAILCRTRKTVKDVVTAMKHDKIPVCELRSSKPNSAGPIRAMLSYLRLCIHPHSNLDVECIIRDAPNHFTSATATRFLFALQAECLQRRKQMSAMELQCEDSHVKYSYYTILKELVHNGFTHIHERLKTTKPQQKLLRTLIEVTTAAHDALGRVYCDIEEVVRLVAERAGFDEGKAGGLKLRMTRRQSHNNNNNGKSNNSNFTLKRRRTSNSVIWDDMMGDDEDDILIIGGNDTNEEVLSIPQLLIEACHSVQEQVLAEKQSLSIDNDKSIPENINVGNREIITTATPEKISVLKDDAYTILQRVIDEFLALLPTDDFGPLQKGLNSELNSTAITVTTVHQAKGKEWPAVIVPCCYEGEFPIDSRSAEEKRVFYVAMSRAMRNLVFMTAELGPSQSRGYDDYNNNNNSCEEQKLQITPYLQPILPFIEVVKMSSQQEEKVKEEV